MTRLFFGVLAGLALGGWLGTTSGIEGYKIQQAQERNSAMRMCSARKGLGTYWVTKSRGTWQCFYEQPSWPHRIKRGALVMP